MPTNSLIVQILHDTVEGYNHVLEIPFEQLEGLIQRKDELEEAAEEYDNALFTHFIDGFSFKVLSYKGIHIAGMTGCFEYYRTIEALDEKIKEVGSLELKEDRNVEIIFNLFDPISAECISKAETFEIQNKIFEFLEEQLEIELFPCGEKDILTKFACFVENTETVRKRLRYQKLLKTVGITVPSIYTLR